MALPMQAGSVAPPCPSWASPGIFGCFARCSIPPCSSPSPLSLLCSSHPSSSSSHALPFPLHHPLWLFPPIPALGCGTNSKCTARQGLQTHCEAGFAPHACSAVKSARLCSLGRGGPKIPQCNRDNSTALIPHAVPPRHKESIMSPLPSRAEEAHAWSGCTEQAQQARGSASASPWEGLPRLLASFPGQGKSELPQLPPGCSSSPPRPQCQLVAPDPTVAPGQL